ncbi:MAG TPA: FAD-binding oxidoreductase [Candidatus Eisenbacteria bacterium]|nr:FAD-binding oxidoreductase [Candidatus Eisenbacteria bacterium]
MAGLPSRSEVVIVGAGVMGCSLAFHLARMGKRQVVVLDRGEIGQGATLACAGGVRAQFSTEINIRVGIEAKRMLRGFEKETGRPADYREIGYLFLLQTEQERKDFDGSVRLQQRLGVEDVRWLEPKQAATLVGGLEVSDLTGAVFCPSDGLAGPSEVTFGYADAARRLGVQIREGAAVTGFLKRGDHVEGVSTVDGELYSDQTVICAGPWAGQVGELDGMAIPILPSKRHVFVSGAMPAISRRTPMTIDFHTSFYFHPEGEGVLFGMSDPGQAPGFDVSVDWAFLDRIAAVARHRWPPLLEAPVKTAWAGLYELTPDSQPLVGPLPNRPGAWIASGFSGHGFMMAPVIGRWLAEWMIRGKSEVDLAPFAPDRFAAGRMEPERNVV